MRVRKPARVERPEGTSPAADRPGTCLLTARNAATGEPVGILWLFERTSAPGTSVFIYDVEVREDLRDALRLHTMRTATP